MLIQAKKSTLLVAVVLSILVGVWLGIYAGNLDPPAAPAPTETAIDETDPRTAIRNSDLPLTISSSGSYYERHSGERDRAERHGIGLDRTRRGF